MEKLKKKNDISYYLLRILIFFVIIVLGTLAKANEMVIGEEKISPGINLVFEAAIKDDIEPKEFHLEEKDSDIHIEALVTWSSDGPRGSMEGGFIPYLNIEVQIINQRTQEKAVYKLTPHLNMSDNFHYANNLKLPGKIHDNYDVRFTISPPKKGDIGFHYDWREGVNKNLISKKIFIYKDQNFLNIARLTRQ
tara:strand:+ start:52 stop:630 length:579 start_codon:yes stop_codon:yes gene_type:complete